MLLKFKKIKDLLKNKINLKNNYLLFIVVITISIFVVYTSYALFMVTKIKSGVYNITAGNLSVDLISSDLTNNQITVTPGEQKEIEVTLINQSSVPVKVILYYKMINPSSQTEEIVIGYKDKTAIPPTKDGLILKKNGVDPYSSTYNLIIKNQSDNDITIEINVKIGLTNPVLSLGSDEFYLSLALTVEESLNSNIVIGSLSDWEVSEEMNSTGGYTLEKFIGDLEDSANILVDKNYYNDVNISPFYKDYVEAELLSEMQNRNAYTVNIPNKVGDKNITEIKEGLFSGYDVINEILIEPNMRIKSANIPEGIKKIGKTTEDSDFVAGVFLYNFHLSEVNFPSTLKEIGVNDFYLSSITDIVIPKSVETIGIQAFAEVFPFNSLTFEGANDRTSQLETIGVGAFAFDLGLPEIIPEINLIIPASVKTISTFAFVGIPLASLTFAGTSTDGSGNDSSLLVNIGRRAFDLNNQNHTIYLPSTLTNVGSRAFDKASLASIYINKLTIPETFDSVWSNDAKKYILNGTGGYTCIENCS